MECQPLRTNAELLEFHARPAAWHSLVDPLASRNRPQQLGPDYNKSSPLLNRTAETARPEVLVCHDLNGNYRSDRFVNGSEKWDDYRFYHWSGIDYFCYFSHDYITIPPVGWINAAHKHGVKVLGTFIVEGIQGVNKLNELLQNENTVKKAVDALVFIAKHCKFEGWLINIEFAVNKDKMANLQLFLKSLTETIRAEVPHGFVIWYDSILDHGQLMWQNELNARNRIFFELCDAIYLNYAWADRQLIVTDALIEENYPHRRPHVFVGIDVFGRGQLAKFDSHITLERITKYNFSVAIFAPSWTYEGLREFNIDINAVACEDVNLRFIFRNDKFWSLLWQHLYSAGPNSLPFYTSFCIGSGKRRFLDGMQLSDNPWLNLSDQKWQPSIPMQGVERHFNEAFSGGSCLKIFPCIDQRVFVCDFQFQSSMIFSFTYKRFNPDVNVEMALRLVDAKTQRQCRVRCRGALSAASNAIYPPLLADEKLRKVLIYISQRQEKRFPMTSPSNGWEICYFYVPFDVDVLAHLVEISISVTHAPVDVSSDHRWVLLGAIHVHEGSRHQLVIDSSEMLTVDHFA